MTRFSSAANSTAASAAHVPYVLFADFDFASGHIRLNSGDRAFSFGGNTYEAVGKLASVGPVKESADLAPDKLEFTLSGVDTALMATTLTEKYHGRSASLYVGYLNASGELVATPHLLWEGRMDTMAARSEEGGSVISLVCEHRLVIWNKAAGFLYTDEHQKLFDATDNFLDQVARLPNKTVQWGAQSFVEGGSGGGGRRNRNPRTP